MTVSCISPRPPCFCLHSKTNPKLAKEWEAAYRALTYPGTEATPSYGLSCPQLQYLGRPLPVTDALRATYRTNQAIGR